jgi:acyl carrier protein
MGLAIVELVMAIEDEFRIEIPNDDAARLAVIGELFDYVLQTLRQRGETPDEAQTWERFRAVVVRQLGVRPDEVVRSAHVVRDLHAD